MSCAQGRLVNETHIYETHAREMHAYEIHAHRYTPVFEPDDLVDEQRLCGASLSVGKNHKTMLEMP